MSIKLTLINILVAVILNYSSSGLEFPKYPYFLHVRSRKEIIIGKNPIRMNQIDIHRNIEVYDEKGIVKHWNQLNEPTEIKEIPKQNQSTVQTTTKPFLPKISEMLQQFESKKDHVAIKHGLYESLKRKSIPNLCIPPHNISTNTVVRASQRKEAITSYMECLKRFMFGQNPLPLDHPTISKLTRISIGTMNQFLYGKKSSRNETEEHTSTLEA